jgi:hypothetical protein
MPFLFLFDFLVYYLNLLRLVQGKTMCSVACAYADWLNKGKKLVFIIAPVSEDLGSSETGAIINTNFFPLFNQSA